MRPAALAVLLAILPSGRSEHLEFAEWTIPVSEETGIVEYRVVSLEEREAHIELQRDLVIRGAFGRDFYRPRSIAIAPNGEIFVLFWVAEHSSCSDAARCHRGLIRADPRGPP